MREVMHLLQGEAALKRIAHIPDAIRPRTAEFHFDDFTVARALIETIDTHFQPA